MRRVLLGLAIAATALGSSLGAGIADAGGGAGRLQLRNTSVGRILVDARGFTLYTFTRDGRNRDACVRISGCREIWPPVTTSAKPAAGPGVRSSLVGTITVGRVHQVTYAGHPLYRYSADSRPGQTFYVNAQQFGGRWPAIAATGRQVR